MISNVVHCEADREEFDLLGKAAVPNSVRTTKGKNFYSCNTEYIKKEKDSTSNKGSG